MNAIDLAPVYSEKAFRRFEPIIAYVIKQFPGPVTLDPTNSGFLPNTYQCRLRDAITSYRKYRWPSTLIRLTDFETLVKIKVSFKDGIIRVGSREALHKAAPVVEPIEIMVKPPDYIEPLDITNKLMDPAKTICYLSSWRALNRPIPVIGLTDADIVHLEQNYDVLITKQTNGTFLIE